jgi:hypothetical protein
MVTTPLQLDMLPVVPMVIGITFKYTFNNQLYFNQQWFVLIFSASFFTTFLLVAIGKRISRYVPLQTRSTGQVVACSGSSRYNLCAQEYSDMGYLMFSRRKPWKPPSGIWRPIVRTFQRSVLLLTSGYNLLDHTVAYFRTQWSSIQWTVSIGFRDTITVSIN